MARVRWDSTVVMTGTTSPLTVAEIEEGCRKAATLYPWIPPMIIWRGWEYAAYRRFTLTEPVLDVGCGDGRFFRLVFPDCRDVAGVELDEGVADRALRSGVYRHVHRIPAAELPADDTRYGSAFANCSLEHMDDLPSVLKGIHASLAPGAPFLCSVVTHRFVEWSPLPFVIAAAGAPDVAARVQRGHETYHHLVNPLSREEWRMAFQRAGFTVEHDMPIIPELTARLFLFVDQFVHLRREDGGEWHEPLIQYLQRFPAFHDGFGRLLSGVLAMESDFNDGVGLVAWLRKNP
jgi:SAM-dependent methyltransferase